MESKFVSFEPRGDKTEFTIYSIDQSLDVLVPIENTSIISKRIKERYFEEWKRLLIYIRKEEGQGLSLEGLHI